MNRLVALVAILLAIATSAPATAEVITIPGELAGYPTPPSFVIRAAGVNFDDQSSYIWVDSEGNCRWHYRQVCHPTGNGQVVCREEREWKCDTDTAFYRLPASCTVDTGAKRAYYTDDNGQTTAYGKVKSFLWSKWIALFDGADLDVTYQGASLVIDTDAIGGGLQKDQFRDLYEADAE